MSELQIYFEQAVTMLSRDGGGGERERWLDWVLSQLLDPGVHIKLGTPARKQLFPILSTVFLQEIHRVSEAHATHDCSEHLISYLVKGRGYALVLGMVRIQERGSCPLELCILLLFLASRLENKLKESEASTSAMDSLVEPPQFGIDSTPARKHRNKKPSTRARRRAFVGFPDGTPAAEAGDRAEREVENLAEYEQTTSEDDSDSDYPRSGTVRVQHINYFKYFDHGDIESESLARSCKVAPPASFADLHRPPSMSETADHLRPPSISETADNLRPPAMSETVDHLRSTTLPETVNLLSPRSPESANVLRSSHSSETTNLLLSPSESRGSISTQHSTLSTEALLLTEVLKLSVGITSGAWSPVSEKDKELVLQIINIASDLVKMEFPSELVRLLELRVLLNCLSSLKLVPQPLRLLTNKGVEELKVLVSDPKVISLSGWPSICREIIQIFEAISASNQSTCGFGPSQHLQTQPKTFFDFSLRLVECVSLNRAQIDWTSGEIAKLFGRLVALLADTTLHTPLLWSQIALKILELTVLVEPRANKVDVFHSLATLARTRKVSPEIYFHLVDKLVVLSSDGVQVTEAFLRMLERTAENLTDSWDEDRQEDDLQVSPDNSADEDVKIVEAGGGFRMYLRVLLSADTATKELVISHLDSIICTLRSELRLQLATQVILPYLKEKFETEDEDKNVVVSVLDLLCSLVKEQPTAMALIREQRAWSSVKRFGCSGGELSNVCQQIIKTLILNSHKFKKIRLSEAEAMALQDDENDRINFDERDRNAQYWLFKQLYHVLVQSSNIVLTSGWPTQVNHLTTAWQVTLDLVRRVPEFFLFAVERGITDINIRLTESLLAQAEISDLKEVAKLLGALINFQVYVIVNFDLMNEELLHTNINQTRDTLTDLIFPKIKDMIRSRGRLSFCRVLLSSVLESSYVTEMVSREGERHDINSQDCEESGYEADESESTDTRGNKVRRDGSYRVTFTYSFHFFVDCFLGLFDQFQTDAEFMYSVEYLLFKLVNNCGRSKENAKLFNEEDALTRIYAALQSLLSSGLRLENFCEMVLSLTENVGAARLLPSTLRAMFQLMGRDNRLQQKVLLSVSRLLKECRTRQEFPGTLAVQNASRFRAVSSGSSDSGLDSANSSVAISPVPSADSSQPRSFSFHEDLGPDYAVVLRIKLSPAIKKDCWLTLLIIENPCETIGLHINVKKGLKLTLANSVETIAAAETTFKSMLFPDQWIHLAFNLGTISEGKRETKTLTAFVNCQKVWGVGLCVDKVQSKVRKKDITVTAGPLDPMSDLCHSSLIYSDIHLLKNCILSQENVLLNYICGPRDFNGFYQPHEICLTEIRNYLPDLLNSCTKIVSEPKVVLQHLDFANSVVAHFSPFSFWKKVYGEDISSECWTPTDGLCKAGGAECIIMMPLEAIEKGFPMETIAETLSNCLAVLTSNQRIYDEFKVIGGFNLVGSILSSKKLIPDISILDVVLQSSSVLIGADQYLFYPQLLQICLQYVERFETPELLTVITKVLKFISELLSDTNPALDLNMHMMKKHATFDAILSCLQTFGESCHEPLPREDISNLLSSLPSSPEFLVKMMYLVLTLLPPYLLYLPYLTRSLLHVTMVKEKKNPALINQVHTSDVVDVSQALANLPDEVIDRLSEETAILASRRGSKEIFDHSVLPSDEDFDLEIYEFEEDKVSDWEVLTREHSTSRPATPGSYTDVNKHGNLAAILLHKILSGFTILSDTESSMLAESEYSPESFLPLVGHPSSDVHSSSLDLIALILERSKDSKKSEFLESGGYQQLAALIQDATPSSQLISSALSLLHGHPIDLNIPFEFNKRSPPQLNMAAVCLLPPLMVSSLSYLSLGHNLLCHVHELLANIPQLTCALMSEHLLQALLAGLVKLGDMPEVESDIFGCNESELLLEDINNILRMLIVFFADKPGQEYEELLDILFLASGLLKPFGQGPGKPKLGALSEGSAGTLRLGVCLILEEVLLTVEAGLARMGDRPTVPRYFQKEEFQDVDQENPVNKPIKGRQASASILISRLNQICKFSVNYLTSRTNKLVVEEETLGLSILNLCMDVAIRKNSNNSLLKGLNDAKSLGGTLILHLLMFGTEKKKVELVKFLDVRDNVVHLFTDMFPSPSLREHLRVCLLSLMKSSKIFCSSEDSKRVTLFYGRILNKTLFPEGPDGNFEPAFPVNHTSYPPWKAECFRCVSLFLAQVNQDSKKKAGVASRFTEKVVERHDLCRKFFLEQGRERVSRRQKSLRSWRRIIGNQTHPLALWHDPQYEPKSLVLENITGLSGTYIRFKRAHAGIHKDKFFKPGFKFKCSTENVRYSFLLGDRDSEENLNSKLDFPEQIQLVEAVKEVTPTDLLDCDLVVSQDTLHIFSAASWTSEISQIESISKRRYQLKHIALEFFLQSGENHLIVFKSQEYRENFVKYMLENGVCLNPKSDFLQNLTKKWRQGGYSNFKYLTELNSLAGRTPNDLMQYPVFPWILADYTSAHLDLTDPASFRNLRQPIAIQEDRNREKYQTTYRLLADNEGAGLPSHMGPYHYASHYSNTGIVLHLMVRLPPFTQEFIKFQDGNFDLADRSFHSLSTSWEMVSHVSTSDVKELIPQLFYLPEMFENNEGYALGKRQNGKEVDSVELPPWATDARIFVKIHRQALESSLVKKELSHWLDLVFGYKQRGSAAVEAVNVFHPATYAHNLDQAEDELEKRARQTMIATYGQTPLQLFTAQHPLADIDLNLEKTSPSSVYRTVTGLRWGNYVGSPAYPTPYVVWQQAQPFQVRSLVRLESNQVVGLPSNSVLVDNLCQDIGSGQFLASAQTSAANVVSWGHGDSALYCRPGKQGEESQVALLPTTDPVVIGAANPKVSTLWLGHKSGRISVYKLSRGSGQSKLSLDFVTRLYGHMSDITSLVVSPEYSLAVSCSSKGFTMTWDLHSQTCLHHTASADYSRLETPTTVISAISESCGDIAVAANSTLTLYTINLNKVCQTTIRGVITALTFSHLEEGKSVNSILIGTQGGGVRLYSSWDLTHMRDVVGCPPSPITALCFSLDCLSLVVSTKNSFVTIFEKSGSHGLNRTPKYISIQ